jgi:hypothetical protein
VLLVNGAVITERILLPYPRVKLSWYECAVALSEDEKVVTVGYAIGTVRPDPIIRCMT